jgi:hypothetical protein
VRKNILFLGMVGYVAVRVGDMSVLMSILNLFIATSLCIFMEESAIFAQLF